MSDEMQVIIENMLGLTVTDGKFINSHRDEPIVQKFCGLLFIQSNGYDPAGFAMLEAAFADVRKLAELLC